MRKITFLLCLQLLLISCNSDDGNDLNSNSFTGNYSATMDGGFLNDIPVNVNISVSSENYTIKITGNEVEPEIILTGLLVTNIIRIDSCTNLCYQGDGNITNAGLVEVSDGKRIIYFGVYFSEDGDTEDDAYIIKVTENQNI